VLLDPTGALQGLPLSVVPPMSAGDRSTIAVGLTA
jgi:hypothetical protein